MNGRGAKEKRREKKDLSHFGKDFHSFQVVPSLNPLGLAFVSLPGILCRAGSNPAFERDAVKRRRVSGYVGGPRPSTLR